VRILVDGIDALGVERARTPDNADNLVALEQQKLSQIRAILTGDSCDKCALHGAPFSLKQLIEVLYCNIAK